MQRPSAAAAAGSCVPELERCGRGAVMHRADMVQVCAMEAHDLWDHEEDSQQVRRLAGAVTRQR